MFTFSLVLLNLVAGLRNGLEGRKPCCSSSSTSSSEDCPPCEQQYVSLNNNDGAHPLYYGLPNSGFPTSQTFLINTGPYGGAVIAWDCYCAGDQFFLYANGEFCATDGNIGIRDDQCSQFESDPRNCLFNLNFSALGCPLPEPNSLYNITVIQATLPYGGGSGFISYFDSNDENVIPCVDNGYTCNFEPYQRQYPCDFGN